MRIIILFFILFLFLQPFYYTRDSMIAEDAFFQQILQDETIYHKKLLRKRYNFIKKLIRSEQYFDAVRELAQIKHNYRGRSLQYIDFMLGRLYCIQGSNRFTNETVFYRHVHSNHSSGTVVTNYYEYMVSELIDLYSGEHVSPSDLRFLINSDKRTYYINAVKAFSSIISNKYKIPALRERAVIEKAKTLLLLDKDSMAEKELTYFLEYYPVSRQRIFAYYHMSRVFIRREEYAKAIAWLARILRDYPEGEHVPYVKLKILFLNELKLASGLGDMYNIIKKYEKELNIRNELNDYFGTLLDKVKNR